MNARNSKETPPLTQALIIPPDSMSWEDAFQPLFGISAIARILLGCSRAGIERCFVISGAYTDRIKDLLDGWMRNKDLPRITYYENQGAIEGLISEMEPGRPVVVVRGNLVFHPRLVAELWESWRGTPSDAVAIASSGKEATFQMLLCLPGRLTGIVFADGSNKAWKPKIHGLRQFLPPPELRPIEASGDGRKKAEQGILNMLGKEGDRPHVLLVRKISSPLLGRLAHGRVNPNLVTIFGFGLAVLGIVLLALEPYWAGVAGAFLLYLSWIFDCVDGTLARLTFSESLFGQKLDMHLGNISNFGVFAALTLAVYNGQPAWKMALFLLLVLGGLGLGFAMTLKDKARRKRKALRGGKGPSSLESLLQKINHREYSLVLLIFALFNARKWFLWFSLGGIHLFWITLLALNLRETLKDRSNTSSNVPP